MPSRSFPRLDLYQCPPWMKGLSDVLDFPLLATISDGPVNWHSEGRARRMNTEVHSPGERTDEGRAHRQRRKILPPMQAGEVEHLMAAFLANSSIATCPTRYAAPTEHAARSMPGER